MLRLSHAFLDLALSCTPNALAATMGTQALTFRQIDQATNAMTRVLASLGVTRGSRVMLQAETTLDHLAFFMAVQRLGAAFIPLLPTWSQQEVESNAAYIRPHLVVFDPAREENGRDLERGGVTVATIGGGDRTTLFHSIDALVAKASTDKVPPVNVSEDDTHAIFLTSGSTGQPKGVMVSHRATWLRSINGASRSPFCGGGGELMTFPMYHWAGWNYVLENWAHRRAVHFVERLDGQHMAEAIDRWRPEYLYCIPALWERLLDPGIDFDTSSIRFVSSGTSTFDPKLMDRIRERFPHAGRGIFYGSTEFGGALTMHGSEIDRRPGSVGLPYPGCDADIVDGELRLRSLTMMDGYFELPDQTAEVFDDGWYLTGDLAERDADGFFSITGRRREVIRSGGETVAPAEVELALKGFPGMLDVAVIGVPDPVWGETVCAAVVVAPDCDAPTLESLRGYVGDNLAPYKHPRRIVQLSELPRTAATGQIMRSRIKQAILDLG